MVFVLFYHGFISKKRGRKLSGKATELNILDSPFPPRGEKNKVTLPNFRKLRMLGCESDLQQPTNRVVLFAHTASELKAIRGVCIVKLSPLFALTVLLATN